MTQFCRWWNSLSLVALRRKGAAKKGWRVRVLFVTSEMEDFVQTGGLGAVASALPRALKSVGDVRVVIPAYPEVLRTLHPVETIAECDAVAGLPPARLGLSATQDGLPIYVVECPQLYERAGGIYGSNGQDWPDN